jgi:hypothetical protein
MPKRIQRKRTAGWQMPDNAVYVGRTGATNRPTWGNPVRVGQYFMIGNPMGTPFPLYCSVPVGFGDEAEGFTFIDSPATAVAMFRKLIEAGYISQGAINLLRGRDLVCWCPLDQPCHADVLLELANPPSFTNGDHAEATK